MNNSEIISQAIDKAVANGFDFEGWTSWQRSTYGEADIIYNHDFAKALWGEEETTPRNKHVETIVKQGWKYHLQQMVIAEDPIKYLGENIQCHK